MGDTYTYFAGMTMAVVGILGHYRCASSLPTIPLLDITSCVNHKLGPFELFFRQYVCVFIISCASNYFVEFL